MSKNGIYQFVKWFGIGLCIFCLSGVAYSVVMYFCSLKDTGYINAAAGFACGLLAALVQFAIILQSKTKNSTDKANFTIKLIDEMIPLLNEEIQKFVPISVINSKTINGQAVLSVVLDPKTSELIFIHDNYSLSQYVNDYCKLVINSKSMLVTVLGKDEAIKYNSLLNNPQNNSSSITIYHQAIISNCVSSVNIICDKMDFFFSAYYNGLLSDEMAEKYINSNFNEYIDKMTYFILFSREAHIKNDKTSANADWVYLYKYIKERFIKFKQNQ